MPELNKSPLENKSVSRAVGQVNEVGGEGERKGDGVRSTNIKLRVRVSLLEV